ncbi:MAG: protein kinase [Planctomycetes bacterium]|nr:protein kinase [Planctomycetota bacterium]
MSVPDWPPDVQQAAQDPARRLGRFVVLAELGRGGMGMVLRAFDPAAGRPVAIKLVTAAAIGPEAWARFEREATATARLQHPGIVKVHEVGQDRGRPFLVMELVEGESLEELLARGPVPRRQAVALARDVALALAHAHERGVIHRDLKPGNVLVDRFGRPRLTDFGLARLGPSALTRTGELLGTPHYMAPEQAGDSASTHGPPTDVYGLGAVLYHLLVGRPPFEGGSLPALLKALLTDPPPPPRRLDPTIDPALERLVLRCLAKEPAARFPDGAALAAALEAWLSGPPPRQASASLAGVAALVLVVVVVVVVVGAVGAWALFGGADASPGPQALDGRVAAAPDPTPAAPSFPPQCEGFLASRGGVLRLAGVIGAYGRRHAEGVKAVAVSADGRVAVSAAGRWDHDSPAWVHVWDTATGQERRAWRAQRGWPHVAVTDDGGRVVTGSSDGVVVAWDATTGRELTRREGARDPVRGSPEPVRGVHLLDADRALVAREDGQLSELELRRGGQQRELVHLGARLRAAAPLPGGREALVVLADRQALVVDLAPGGGRRRLDGAAGFKAWGAAVHPERRLGLAWGDGDGGWLRQWALDSGALAPWPQLDRHVRSAAWVPGAAQVLVGYHEPYLLRCDPDGPREPTPLAHLPAERGVWALAVTPGGDALLGLESRWLVLLGPDGRERWAPDRAWRPVSSLSPLRGGRLLVGFREEEGGGGGEVRVVDLGVGQVQSEVTSPIGAVLLGVETDGAPGVLLVGAADLGREVLAAWEPGAPGAAALRWRGPDVGPGDERPGWQTAATASQGGKVVFTGGYDGSIHRWDRETGGRARVMEPGGARVAALAEAPRGGVLAACVARVEGVPSRDAPGTLLWLDPSGDPQAVVPFASGAPCSLAPRTEGDVVVGCQDGQLRTWRPGEDDGAPWPKGHEERVVALALDPAQRRVVSGSLDGTVRLWDVAERRELASIDLGGAGDAPTAVAFVDEGDLVVGTARGVILRFRVEPAADR